MRWKRKAVGRYELRSSGSRLPHAVVDRGPSGRWWWAAWWNDQEDCGQAQTLARAKEDIKAVLEGTHVTLQSEQIPTPDLVRLFFKEIPNRVRPGPPRDEAHDLLEAFERWRRAS